MRPSVYLANYLAETFTGVIPLRNHLINRLAELAVATRQHESIDELACAAGYCPDCGSEGEILRSPSGNANDPRATREPCPECVGGSPEDR